jgi:hypothetical protein
MEVTKIEPVLQSTARYADDPDQPLVEASISGDISAFEILVRRYTPWLLRIAPASHEQLGRRARSYPGNISESASEPAPVPGVFKILDLVDPNRHERVLPYTGQAKTLGRTRNLSGE